MSADRRLKSVYAPALYCLGLCCIMKTCLYNFDPRKPHFYIVKLGFTGVYIIFLISAQNIDYGYSLVPPRRTASSRRFYMITHNLCFKQKYEKYQIFLSEHFQFWEVKFSIYLNRHVLVMVRMKKLHHWLYTSPMKICAV